jgi:DNA-binding transcriptional MerR regulator
VGGVPYFSTAQVAEMVGVSRQTLWRWRKSALVPSGARFRNGQVLFSQEDITAIRAYAEQLEPLGNSSDQQPTPGDS